MTTTLHIFTGRTRRGQWRIDDARQQWQWRFGHWPDDFTALTRAKADR